MEVWRGGQGSDKWWGLGGAGIPRCLRFALNTHKGSFTTKGSEGESVKILMRRCFHIEIVNSFTICGLYCFLLSRTRFLSLNVKRP